MSFLNDLKIAVINRDLETLKKLSSFEPDFKSIEEANEMLKYIVEAKKILEEEKKKLSSEMQDIKKFKSFILLKRAEDLILRFNLKKTASAS